MTVGCLGSGCNRRRGFAREHGGVALRRDVGRSVVGSGCLLRDGDICFLAEERHLYFLISLAWRGSWEVENDNGLAEIVDSLQYELD